MGIAFASLSASPFVRLASSRMLSHIWLGHSMSFISSPSRVGASACAETMYETAS